MARQLPDRITDVYTFAASEAFQTDLEQQPSGNVAAGHQGCARDELVRPLGVEVQEVVERLKRTQPGALPQLATAKEKGPTSDHDSAEQEVTPGVRATHVLLCVAHDLLALRGTRLTVAIDVHVSTTSAADTFKERAAPHVGIGGFDDLRARPQRCVRVPASVEALNGIRDRTAAERQQDISGA